jgi:hypothetical protein
MAQVWRPEKMDFHFDDMFHAFITVFVIITSLYVAQVGRPERMDFHFDDMFHAFITVFVIITLDNWTDIMFPLMSVSLLSAPLPSSHTPFAALGK